jgi:small subunit ribosomal protein S15
MARMHSRKKGKSGSTRPLRKTQPSWIRHNPKEVELVIVKLAKEGNTASQIGIILRDTYGIPNVKMITKKKITQILNEKNLSQEIPEDLMALIKKLVAVKKHLDNNKHDMSALRGMQLTESKIKRLVKYYKRIKKLPIGWKYDSKNISLYTE